MDDVRHGANLAAFSLQLDPGDVVIVSGGSGKFRILQMALGLLEPDRGRVRVFGEPPLRARGSVGYVPQRAPFDLDFPIRALDVVLMGRLRARGLRRRFDAEDWLRLVERYGVTTTFAAPTPIRQVCRLPDHVKARYDRSSMRRMVANAAPWSQALKEAYLADFPEDSLWEVYGSTELGVNCVLAPEHQRSKPGSCGLAAPGVEIRLYGEDGTVITEPNIPGELYVRSKSSFEAYYKADDQFQSGRREDFHSVGDVAYRDEEGFYYICDRKKDMIISGGMNIYPAEIESALESHPRIYEAAVFAIPSEEWGESVHACIVRTDESLTEADIDAFSREKLASYKIPRSIEFVSEIPKTGSNKILKRELRQKYWEGHETQVGA